MSLILATGTNLGKREQNLSLAKIELDKNFSFIAQSRIFESPAVDYEEQPDFYNQLLEYDIPKISPAETIKLILEIEEKLGRFRDIPKGPRLIDIDIIFWATKAVNLDNLTIPHPAWNKRSFVVYPLKDLPYFKTIEKSFIIPKSFSNTASPIV